MGHIKLCEEHNQAFYYWEEALVKGDLCPGATLIHVDSHGDMDVPMLSSSICDLDTHVEPIANLERLRQFSENDLNIGNYIIPSVLRGTISDILWIKPPWARIEPQCARKKNRIIGSLHGKGIIIDVDFDKRFSCCFPDKKEWSYRESYGFKLLTRKTNVVLNIDLDYFSCNPSATEIMSINISIDEYKRLEKYLRSSDGYWNLRNNYTLGHEGERYTLTIGKQMSERVQYNNNEELIELLVDLFIDGYRTSCIEPALIIICQSVKSGFTPAVHKDLILKRLLEGLEGRRHATRGPQIAFAKRFQIARFCCWIRTGQGIEIYNVLTHQETRLRGAAAYLFEMILKGASYEWLLEQSNQIYGVDRDEAATRIKDLLHDLMLRQIIL